MFEVRSPQVHTLILAEYFITLLHSVSVSYDKFKFDKQINNVVKSCFFNLRLLAKVNTFLSVNDLEKLIHAFIFSQLDYYNTIHRS